MSSATTQFFNLTSMANGCLTSHRTLFTATKASYPIVSLSSKPIKFLNITFSSSIPSWVSLQKKSSLITHVAQTSDWAQQGEETQVEENEEDSDVGVEGFVEQEGEEEETYVEPPEEAKLFVGNLPYDMDSEKLAGLFDQAGVVEVAEVIYNRETDQSRGFGFITMSTVEEAEKAVEMFSGYDLNGRSLTVNKAAPRGSRPERAPRSFGPSLRIYVGNLPWECDDARLEQVFSEHGKVVDARVVTDRETGRSRGFGFVTMASQTELDDAIAALDGQAKNSRPLDDLDCPSELRRKRNLWKIMSSIAVSAFFRIGGVDQPLRAGHRVSMAEQSELMLQRRDQGAPLFN